MKSKYPFKYIITYIPSYYCNLISWQQGNQRAVYKFKNGILSDYHKKRFVDAINSIVGKNTDEWMVCFVPASCRKETAKRYIILLRHLEENVSVPVHLDSVDFLLPQEPSHIKGKSDDDGDDLIVDSRHFRDKNVILIDDVISTGRTLRSLGNTLQMFGAKKVFGLFFARTIHPNLPRKYKNYTK